ncbi:MAG: polysaccharide deacetylase family protein [Blastopirellula sp.]|nr:MAG: polysaccharide deacetylase family protein [Blastopirellula sp.]
MQNAFTVDVEDYFQVTSFEKEVPREKWDNYEPRVVESTQRILRLLEKHQVQGTFFILGWVAERFPELVKQIHSGGHEIGSHSYWHRLIYTQTPDEFREDLIKSRDILQNIISEPVTVYRAPSFSITNKSLWALDILAEEGFRVDSSIFPTRHDRYGMHNCDPAIHTLETAAGNLEEFPMTVLQKAGLNIPVGGGGYFRLYPLWFTMYALNQINRKHNRPCMFYIHPWEVDPDQPRIPTKSRKSRFRHYINLGSTEKKLDKMLSKMNFGAMRDFMSKEITKPNLELV